MAPEKKSSLIAFAVFQPCFAAREASNKSLQLGRQLLLFPEPETSKGFFFFLERQGLLEAMQGNVAWASGQNGMSVGPVRSSAVRGSAGRFGSVWFGLVHGGLRFMLVPALPVRRFYAVRGLCNCFRLCSLRRPSCTYV